MNTVDFFLLVSFFISSFKRLFASVYVGFNEVFYLPPSSEDLKSLKIKLCIYIYLCIISARAERAHEGSDRHSVPQGLSLRP